MSENNWSNTSPLSARSEGHAAGFQEGFRAGIEAMRDAVYELGYFFVDVRAAATKLLTEGEKK